VLFTVYVPSGIQRTTVTEHLEQIKADVLLVAPDAQVEQLGVAGQA